MNRKSNRNTQAMNRIRKPAPPGAWWQRSQQCAAAMLLSVVTVTIHAAVAFPSLPLQTGAAQPAPNIVFILDDSQSMVGTSGQSLDTGLTWCTTGCSNSPTLGEDAGAPYTKNPLSYNPATTYQPWATSNTTDTALVRRTAASYTGAYSDAALVTGSTTNLSSSTQTYYVPKPAATNLADQRQYYRYQILNTGNRVVRAEWVNTAPPTQALVTASTWTLTGGEYYWGNVGNPTSGGGNGSNNTTSCESTSAFRYQVPADGSVTRVIITTTGSTGTNANPDLYVRSGSQPCINSYLQRSTSSTVNGNESITIDAPAAGWLYIGVFNNASGSGDRTFSNLSLKVQYSTEQPQSTLNCGTSGAGTYDWKNCVDVSSSGDTGTGVRALASEKQNYANWYQYHRTRMKVAKAGGSEAFASLDENYRVGIMGLYPSGSYQQAISGSTGGSAPTFGGATAGNLNSIIPVATNGGLFVQNNRKNWFDHLQGMTSKNATPLRKALDGAGKYFSSARAYESTDSNGTTYLSCRQNFAILTTDGYWNNFGGSDDPDSSYTGTAISGDEENGSAITGPNDQSFQYLRAAPYWYNNLGENASGVNGDGLHDGATTLADIAMHYWKTDLRTTDVSGHIGSAENKVPSSTSNPAFWQHMVTFGVGLGVRGQLTDAQLAHAMAGTGTSGNGGFWPAPFHATNANDNPQNIDDLRHAALNARGSYINANDAEQFSDGITDALNRIGERRGSASNVLANSTSISTDSFVYQATYMSGSWRGELLAYPISSAGLGSAEWRASEHIRTWNTRNIFTVGASSGGSTFPNSTQSTALGTAATALGVTGTELANYLRGDASKEKRNSGVLRDRTQRRVSDSQVISSLLGDIVNSSPFYVADSQTVFVGANDGMLHAIDASNTTANGSNTTGGGTERFTYVPRGVDMSQLAQLANPLYGTNVTTQPHRYFVDGPIVVSALARTPGKNYLIGGLGRGGKGVYALDVTTPASFDASKVLWDNTGSSAPTNMGNVISEPLISKLNNSVTAAVVANGANSTSGTASLFIINLDDGTVIKELDTGTSNNGLSAPRAVDVNADGRVDFFFAGDLLGNVWRFDVSSTSTSSWTVNKVFTARDTSNTVQSITGGLAVARDPATGKIWLFFGTGRYLTATDQADTSTQSFYGVTVGTTGAVGTDLLRASLQTRTIDVVDSATGRRAFEPYEAGVVSTKNGWVIDLNNPSGTGERVISAPVIFSSALIFSSIVPPGQNTVNSCEAGGSGYLNALNAFSGTSLDSPFFDIPNDSTDTISDDGDDDGDADDEDGDGDLPVGSMVVTTGMPTGPVVIGNLLVAGDSSGGTPSDENIFPPGGNSTRRVSWREVFTDQ